ncbi:hypothetical protein [Lactococcus ileimucosae]|nr:hypothetical protein [Lactococcus ileimucosae]MBL3717296.1 hypothetical protein [Lactococcus garvieae]
MLKEKEEEIARLKIHLEAREREFPEFLADCLEYLKKKKLEPLSRVGKIH